VKNITYCCLAQAQSGGSFVIIEELQMLQKKKEACNRQGKRIHGSKGILLGKREGCVYINKGIRYRKQIGSWEGRKRILEKKTIL
jgi:hypothetical protein